MLSSPSTTICKRQSRARSTGEALAPRDPPAARVVWPYGCRGWLPEKPRRSIGGEGARGYGDLLWGWHYDLRRRRRGRMGWYIMKHAITALKVAQAMELSKKLLSFAGAMAVCGGRVLYVGSFDAFKGFKGRHAYGLNLSGNMVLPGFIDSHVHLNDGGLQD